MSRCAHDLDPGSCADCRPRPGVIHDRRGSGPAGGSWSVAAYHGTCTGCGEDIVPDDEITADGSGGWLRRKCCGEYETHTIRGPVRLVSWGLDPAHPGYENLTWPATRRSP